MFAVDVSPNRNSASIVLLSRREDGVIHGEVIESDVGTAWVGHRLKELKTKWNPEAIVAIAGSQTESLVDGWKRDGVRVKLLRFGGYVRACGMFYDAVMQGKFAHLGDELLTAAVSGAKRAWKSDAASWYWSRRSSDLDITPLVALTAAVAGLESRERKPALRRIIVL